MNVSVEPAVVKISVNIKPLIINLSGESPKTETVVKAVSVILDHGKKLGEKVMEYIDKAKRGEIPDDEKVPEEVQAEIISTLKEILKETSEPVYMDGVALFCDGCLTEEVKEELTEILNSANSESENNYEAPEGKEGYLDIVQKFTSKYCENFVSFDEGNFEIEDDVIYLNFDTMTNDYFRVYNPDEIREFINAMNHLLDNRYITRFTVY